ncbi:MAG: DUF2905 domain-containing protein [Anaerolineales bacterium]|nr:DUF2905 domain-containing protein [Anaerolineales bacterium]
MIAGLLLFAAGALVYLLSRAGLPLGRLPGDLRLQTENLTCIVPLASMIILSILLTIILNLAIRFLNR